MKRGLGVPMALAAAGGFHLAALPAHRSPWWFALFFGATAVFQLAAAGLLLVRPTRLVKQAVVASSLAVLAIWAVARTTGLPFGPEAGIRHELGVLDGLCAAVEVVVIVGLLLPSPARWVSRTAFGRRLAIGALAVAFATAAGGGLAVAESPHEHHADHTGGSGGNAPVDAHHGAGHELGLVGGGEHHGVGHVLGSGVTER